MSSACVLWCWGLGGTPYSGTGASQTLLPILGNHFHLSGASSSFDVKFVPGLIVWCCAMFSWCPWEAGSFLGRDGEVWREGRCGELTEVEGGLCVQDILYKTKIKY